MKKIFVLLMTVAVVAALLLGCMPGAPEVPPVTPPPVTPPPVTPPPVEPPPPKVEEPGRYYNRDKGFSIIFPNEWETDEGFMGTTVRARSPQESPNGQFCENVNVVVEELPEVMSLEEYFQLNLAALPELLTDFQVYENGQLTLENADAKWFGYSFRMGTTTFRNLAYFLVKGRRGYVITCTASPDTFATYRNRFEEIARSFKFE